MSDTPQTPAAVAYQLMWNLLKADNKDKPTRAEFLQAYRDAITETQRGK